MFTLTMLYVSTFATTHCSACSMYEKDPPRLSRNTFRMIRFTPGAMPGNVPFREPMMLATFEPCPFGSEASASPIAKS